MFFANRWNKESYDLLKKEQEKYSERFGPDAAKRPSAIRAKIRRQAEELLLKKETVEVEKELKA